ITQMKLENGEAESSLQRKQETVQDLGNKIRTNEHNIALKNAEIKQAQQDIDAAGEEIRLMNEEIDSLAVEKDNCGTQLEEISKKRVVQENNRDEQVEALNADKTLRQQKENVLRKKEQRMLTLYQQLSQKNNELTALQTRTQFLCSRMEKQNQEKAETREQIKKNLEHLQAVEENHAAKTKQFTLLQSEHGELSRQIGECQNRIKEENESLSSLKETYLSSASLLGSLNELWKKFEGFQDGVKSLMSNTNGDRLPGLREVLVDVLRAPAEYEMAVEAVLGEKLQSVIVDTYSDSVNAISYLNANRSGRGSFIPVQFKSTHQTPLLLNGNSGVVGKVVDLIQCKEEYRPLLHHLLNNVVLVSDLETGLKLYADENFNGTVVTRNGELIDAQGTVSGGSRDENSNLLTQKRKMETLATQVESRKREVESAQSKHDALVHRLEELQESLKKIGVHLHETEIAGAHIKNDMEHLQKEIGRLEQKQSTLDYELSNADHESQELTDHQDALQQKIREEEAEKTEEEQKVAALKIELEQHHIVIESKSQELNALLVEIASTQGKIENLQTERQRLNLQQEILRQKIDQRDQSRRNNASQIDRRRVNVGELEKEILQQTEERDRLNKEITMEAETLQLKTEELNQKPFQEKSRKSPRPFPKLRSSCLKSVFLTLNWKKGHTANSVSPCRKCFRTIRKKSTRKKPRRKWMF
ncbi:MAG: chromosome segregation protein SMC, partial [Nitrospinales bacterium]